MRGQVSGRSAMDESARSFKRPPELVIVLYSVLKDPRQFHFPQGGPGSFEYRDIHPHYRRDGKSLACLTINQFFIPHVQITIKTPARPDLISPDHKGINFRIFRSHFGIMAWSAVASLWISVKSDRDYADFTSEGLYPLNSSPGLIFGY